MYNAKVKTENGWFGGFTQPTKRLAKLAVIDLQKELLQVDHKKILAINTSKFIPTPILKHKDYRFSGILNP